ncbi:hypothetical protein [Aquamicrobium sp. LC103]|uniref:hypothetical protein n=1 Tax=Aquamicrobium sp. LC103 TaxID=1120658 RepID=UPI00063EC1A0|nr:hypothetical protein [Aquamicrobium sp. LC103]TKT77510.1 hypothetical protein XW59_013650 [Aquamicrobium sp. LC103]
MLKLVVAAIWISIATTGAVLYSFQSRQSPEDTAAEPNAFQGLDYVKSGVISVPLFSDGKVFGYFLARLVYTAEAKRLNQLKLPAEALLTDEVYSYLFANPQIDFTKRDDVDLNAFRDGIRNAVNERIGEPLIRDVLVEQMDFLPKKDVSPNTVREASIPSPAEAPAQ